MTPTGRAIVTIVAIIGATVIAVVEHAQIAAVIGFLGVVLGYVFGDRNGERRLANADQHAARAARADRPAAGGRTAEE